MASPLGHGGLGLRVASPLKWMQLSSPVHLWQKLRMGVCTRFYLSMEPTGYLCLRSDDGSSMIVLKSVVGPPTLAIFLLLSWKKPYPKYNITCHMWSETAREPPFLLLSTPQPPKTIGVPHAC